MNAKKVKPPVALEDGPEEESDEESADALYDEAEEKLGAAVKACRLKGDQADCEGIELAHKLVRTLKPRRADPPKEEKAKLGEPPRACDRDRPGADDDEE